MRSLRSNISSSSSHLGSVSTEIVANAAVEDEQTITPASHLPAVPGHRRAMSLDAGSGRLAILPLHRPDPARSSTVRPAGPPRPAAADEACQPLIDEARSRLRLPAHLVDSAEISRRLQDNARALMAIGVDTPAKLDQFRRDCWRHDFKVVALGLGLSGSFGYLAGMTVWNEWAGTQLSRTTGNPAQLGGLAGLGIGALDVFLGVSGRAILGPQVLNGRDGQDLLPACIASPDLLTQALTDAARGIGLNVLKNLPRIIAPVLQAAAEGALDGSIARRTSDRIDVAIDGGGGVPAAIVQRYLGLAPKQYDTRLMLRSDVAAVAQRLARGTGRSAAQTARAMATAFVSPVPPAAVLVIGAFVAELFAANTAIDSAGQSPGDPLPHDRAHLDMMVAKRVSSVFLMGLLSASLELGLPLVARGGQALQGRAAQFLSRAQGSLPDIGAWARSFHRAPVDAGAERHDAA